MDRAARGGSATTDHPARAPNDVRVSVLEDLLARSRARQQVARLAQLAAQRAAEQEREYAEDDEDWSCVVPMVGRRRARGSAGEGPV